MGDVMKIAVVSEVPVDQKNIGSSVRSGETIRQSLVADDTPDGLNFTVNRTQWLPGASANRTPRHHHTFQQIRWAESGSVNFGPGQNIEAGDIAYFPRGTWYGPQERDQGVTTTFQFGFNGEKQHGSPFWKKYQAPAMERLSARGRFEEGVYLEADPVSGKTVEKDSVQALYEEQYLAHTGQKLVVPPERYSAPILMHPRAFNYYQSAPGVQRKNLGNFYDHPGANGDLRLSMLRLSEGGTYTLDASRAQVAWSIHPGLMVEARIYPAMTYIYSPLG